MKRKLLIALGAVAGYLTWLKIQQDREERDLWAEVTDSFGEEPPAR
ncbi:DLW-39 family protein [Georgenia sp. M64]